MKGLFCGLILLSAVASSTETNGQTAFYSKSDKQIDLATGLSVVNVDNESAFYTDDEKSTLFIDFEAIHVNVVEIVVKDEAGNAVFTESTQQMPVNAIYELDLHQFQNGKYELELRSYTALIKKSFSVGS